MINISQRKKILLSGILAWAINMASALNIYLMSLNGDWQNFEWYVVSTAFLTSLISGLKDLMSFLATPPDQPDTSAGQAQKPAGAARPETTAKTPALEPSTIIEPINVEQIRSDLMRDEGYREQIYLDSEGYPTIGIGHLITPEDEEHGMPVGATVGKSRIDELFEEDFADALNDARSLVSDFDSHPPIVRRNIVNMAFNLGRKRLSKFKKTLDLIKRRQYEEAGKEAMRSKWSVQVGIRADRIKDNFKLAGDNISLA